MGPMEIAALIQGGTALYNTFGKNNPARAAGDELGKIAGYGREAYNPFIQQGQNAMQQLGPQYGQMAGQPTDFYNNILNKYKPSAGYQYKENKLNQLAHNTAAAGGYAGTQGDVRDRSEMISGLLGEDMQKYLENILGIQGAGQTGLHRQADTGFMGAGNLANYLATAGSQQGAYNAFGQNEQNANRNEGLTGLSNFIGGFQKPQGQKQFDLSSLLQHILGGGSMGGVGAGAGTGTGGQQLPGGSKIALNKMNSFSGGTYNPNWLGA